MIAPVLGIALVLLSLGALMAAVRFYQVRFTAPPERVRKLFHVGSGLITLTFPWLFHSAWPVLLLAGITLPAMLALRYVRGLRRGVGSILHGVDRASLGELYFPLGVAAVFLLSLGHPQLYVIPVLILTLADTAAAFVGIEYGRLRYTTVKGQKCWEGSIAFFVVEFFSVHVPLLIFSTTGRGETLLVATIVALSVTLAEALVWDGADNLVIPVASCLLLKTFLMEGQTSLALQLVVLAALAALAAIWRQTPLNAGRLRDAILGASLVWTPGGWLWLP
jgi:phytol kinase